MAEPRPQFVLPPDEPLTTGDDSPPLRASGGLPGWEPLLVAAARGDWASFEQLAHESRTVLHHRALQVLDSLDDADEVVQESLLEAWRNAWRYDPVRGSALTWLGQIVRHRAIDHVRRTSARCAREARAVQGPGAAEVDHTIESVLLGEDHADVRAALLRLTDLQLHAITLVYFEGLTVPQAAARVGVPLGTMKTRIRDGIQRLRGAIDGPA